MSFFRRATALAVVAMNYCNAKIDNIILKYDNEKDPNDYEP